MHDRKYEVKNKIRLQYRKPINKYKNLEKGFAECIDESTNLHMSIFHA
jgi:hypothetical protein